ncbi:MAG TPA: dTDP-4-dehydrorhamnose 3,5-epimerase [Vicinamibacterales bacterium]|jgi:dTDP-4-dehydrorhamnose 3,5-epimerase|nr:dTDP-4-dehydrorhamnose 3,5-epimerase [Vicinamibacterales bacterium]
MRVVPTALPEVLLIESDVHRDVRGFFVETYHLEKFRSLGIADTFVQDNHSQSIANTVRGLHLQVGDRKAQSKLVRVIDGEIVDVCVDVRRGSPSFGRSVIVVLSAENFRQCYIPAGFAHGFAVVSRTAQVEYKCSAPYDPSAEVGIAWDDPQLAIEWPLSAPIVSERDRQNPLLADVMSRLPVFEPDRRPAPRNL